MKQALLSQAGKTGRQAGRHTGSHTGRQAARQNKNLFIIETHDSYKKQ